MNIKIEPIEEGSKKLNVDEVTILEPFDKKIVAELGDKCNVYHKVVLVMKHSTQVYYNMRIILDMEYKRYVNFKQSQPLKLFLNDTFTPM